MIVLFCILKQCMSMKKIGIPRAISYYGNYPFYWGYFTSLGLEIILSDKTTNHTKWYKI